MGKEGWKRRLKAKYREAMRTSGTRMSVLSYAWLDY